MTVPKKWTARKKPALSPFEQYPCQQINTNQALLINPFRHHRLLIDARSHAPTTSDGAVV
jgi:hypothetical protein